MRNNKKVVTTIVAIVLVFAVAITLVACGSKDNSNTGNTPSESSQSNPTNNGSSSNTSSKSNYDGMFLGWLKQGDVNAAGIDNVHQDKGDRDYDIAVDGVLLAKYLQDNPPKVKGWNGETLTFESGSIDSERVVLGLDGKYETAHGVVYGFHITQAAEITFVNSDGETKSLLYMQGTASYKVYYGPELGILTPSEAEALGAGSKK